MYGYVLNDPVNLIDPRGKDFTLGGALAGIAISEIASFTFLYFYKKNSCSPITGEDILVTGVAGLIGAATGAATTIEFLYQLLAAEAIATYGGAIVAFPYRDRCFPSK